MEITSLFSIVLSCFFHYDSPLAQHCSFSTNPHGQPCYTITNNVMFSVRAERKVSMETSDLGRRIRDFIIPNIRKKYHITGQYLSLAAAAEVIQVVRLGLLAAGFGELTEEQLIELGTVLEPEVHQQLRPRSGGKKARRVGNRATVVRQVSVSRHPRRSSTQSASASEKGCHAVGSRNAPRYGLGNALLL